jgi:predicted nucleic acid-binding protein
MTFTSNKIFIDSSLLIEFTKGSKTNLLQSLIQQQQLLTCVNETVVSEFLFYFLALNGNASPRTLQSAARISGIFNSYPGYELIKRFSFLPSDENLLHLVPHLMQKYNLLPNDAIILATCKIHNITKLASHDSDFVAPCSAEGIELLSEEF